MGVCAETEDNARNIEENAKTVIIAIVDSFDFTLVFFNFSHSFCLKQYVSLE